MTDGWQVGDLAVCVGGVKRGARRNGDGCPIGSIHRVANIVRDCAGNLGLVFEDIKSDHPTGGYLATPYYRKILPDAHEACEDEFVTLLKRSRISA